MPKKSECWGIICAAALAAPLPNAAFAADALIDAIAGGKVSGNFRLRYEDVEVKSLTVEDATALTLRSRLGYETAPFQGFTAILEFEDVHTVAGEDEYAPETTGYAPVVDPKETEINRAYLRYRGVPKLDMGLGRQRIVLDNQRFVGSVSWRQDEQTFDAFTAKYDGIADWSFYYAYVDQVNGIADITPIYNFDIESSDNLFNITYSGFSLGKLTAYGYFLDNQTDLAEMATINPALRFQSNDTIGLRFDGVYILPTTAPLRLFYTAEYAKQEFTSATDVEFDTDYSFIEGGVGYASKVGMLSAKVAQEILGSDTVGTAMQGFQTPYATKHAFNGWVDMFLNTPAGGLKDRYVTLAADLQPYGVKLMAMYHKYSEQDGPLTGGGAREFGNEWNLQALKQFGPSYTLGVKYGNYRADSEIATATNIDTKKVWLWGELTF
jgi:hypothetical protein